MIIANRYHGRSRLEEIGKARRTLSLKREWNLTMEYQIFAEIDGRTVPLFHPLAADSDETARDAALALIQSRSDVLEVKIFRGDKMVAALDRSGG